MNPGDAPKLADIHLPADPSWWPPAPGWWLLFVLVLGAFVWLAWLVLPRWRRRRYNARVLAEFETIAAAYHARADHLALVRGLSLFLRRLTLTRAPRAVALSGDAWLAHLDATGGSDEFRRGIGRVLLDAPYRAQQDFDAAALIALTRRWTRARLARSRPEHADA